MYSNIYYALVNSQLNYGITLWGSMGSTSRLSSLFSAQKKCIRTLYRIMICFQRGKTRVENIVLPCTSELCNYISYQVEMVRAQSTNQFIGSITTVARHVGVSILPQLFCHVASS